MEYSFTIEGQLPGQNEFIDSNRIHWAAANKMKKTAQENITQYMINPVEFTKPVHITIEWYEPVPIGRCKRRDPDNIVFAKKFIFDAITKAGILKDDTRKEITGFTDLIFWDQEKSEIKVRIND